MVVRSRPIQSHSPLPARLSFAHFPAGKNTSSSTQLGLSQSESGFAFAIERAECQTQPLLTRQAAAGSSVDLHILHYTFEGREQCVLSGCRSEAIARLC